ncbi:MAG: T9SS type A sorting domain-containing protein, partial [Cyclobacteriaceae bacterium]
SVLLFPNPTKNNIQIESSSIINRIDVFNQLGSPLYSDIYQEKYVQLDMSVFPTGVFFIAIHTDVGRTVKKVVRY